MSTSSSGENSQNTDSPSANTPKLPKRAESPKFFEEGDLERYLEEEREKAGKKGRYIPCDNARFRLKNCLLETECCRELKKTPRQCLELHHPSVPQECFDLASQFNQCKFSLIDKRSRLRGRRYD